MLGLDNGRSRDMLGMIGGDIISARCALGFLDAWVVDEKCFRHHLVLLSALRTRVPAVSAFPTSPLLEINFRFSGDQTLTFGGSGQSPPLLNFDLFLIRFRKTADVL